jgi:hypothetical protein
MAAATSMPITGARAVAEISCVIVRLLWERRFRTPVQNALRTVEY